MGINSILVISLHDVLLSAAKGIVNISNTPKYAILGFTGVIALGWITA